MVILFAIISITPMHLRRRVLTALVFSFPTKHYLVVTSSLNIDHCVAFSFFHILCFFLTRLCTLTARLEIIKNDS